LVNPTLPISHDPLSPTVDGLSAINEGHHTTPHHTTPHHTTPHHTTPHHTTPHHTLDSQNVPSAVTRFHSSIISLHLFFLFPFKTANFPSPDACQKRGLVWSSEEQA